LTTYAQALDFATNAFRAAGVAPAEASVAACALVGAQAWGLGSHGLIRVPQYLRRLTAGGTSLTGEITVTQDLGALALVDGHAGLGVVHMQHAAEMGVKLAKQFGVSAVAVQNSSHCGALAFFAWPALRANCAVLLLTNGPAVVPPPNGSKALMSTSPICVAVPTNSGAILVDMSTTAVARGKIAEYAARGEALPLGWALDESGQPTTDAQVALKGMLAPLGGAKGAALALGLEALTGGLIGPNLAKDVPDIFDEKMDGEAQGISHLIITLDAAAIANESGASNRLDDFVEAVANSWGRVPGSTKTDPDEFEPQMVVEVAPAVRKQLDEWADRLQITRLA